MINCKYRRLLLLLSCFGLESGTVLYRISLDTQELTMVRCGSYTE